MAEVIAIILSIIYYFAIVSSMGMVITYIGQIRNKMSRLLKENLKLLDKMHEGLIVVSESGKSLKFASRPAIALIKQLPKSEAVRSESQLTS